MQRRLENVFVPEDGDDIMPRDGAGSDISDEEKKKVSTYTNCATRVN